MLTELTNDTSNHASNDEIAIVGVGCKFPQADEYRSFWELLEHEKNGIGTSLQPEDQILMRF